MPIIVPPYVQYQAPLFPLRGLWNHAPPEGDRMVAAEIDWGVTTGPGLAVQFQLSGNSPVAFSQIVSMQVDNTSNAGAVQFLFPDSGYTLVVPGYTQITTPVFTNALQFYAFSPDAGVGDRTLFQAFNSIPPPVAVQPSQEQLHAGASSIPLSNGSTQIIPATVSGTLNAIQVIVSEVGAASATLCDLSLIDGTGRLLWFTNIEIPATVAATVPMTVAPVVLRFYQGVSCLISFNTATGGFANFNLYYAVP